MRRSTARRAILALAEVRANGTVRHKDSIHHGAALRGRTEKVPITRQDFYRSQGDNDNELRRKSRSREKTQA